MATYILIGAVLGIIVGHLIPPGHFFWFVVGGISGYVGQYYMSRKYKNF